MRGTAKGRMSVQEAELTVAVENVERVDGHGGQTTSRAPRALSSVAVMV